MEPNKINIDNFFKSLQDAEGQAEDAMFDAIKSKLDEGKISVDDYFKQAIVNAEINAEDISFDNIKQKIEAPKTNIDSYFREALIDYNSTAAAVPFASIQDKLDKDRVVDAPFKDALQNYEGKALDEEFALIRSKVLQIQKVANRRRYAWILLLLLLPLSYIGYHFYNNPAPSKIVAISEPLTDNSATNQNQYQDKVNANNNERSTESKLNENLAVIHEKTTPSGNIKNYATPVNPNASESARVTVNENTNASVNSGNKISENNSGNNLNPAHENVPVIDKAAPSVVSKKEEKSEEGATSNTKESNSSASTAKSNAPENTTSTNIRKPKSPYTLEVMGGLALNDRYLYTDTHSAQYFATRSASDKQTTRFNFGIDLIKNIKKINLGVGFHESQYGQQGVYQLTRNIADSVILWHDSTHTKIDGIFYFNQRDTTFHTPYNNIFNSIELPIHVSYQICTATKWDFQAGAGIMLTYLANAKGIMPNSISSEAIQIQNNLTSFRRFGSAVSVNMKFHYNITNHVHLGSDLFIKTNISSIHKQTTGITELPYAFGWRLGLGYKF